MEAHDSFRARFLDTAVPLPSNIHVVEQLKAGAEARAAELSSNAMGPNVKEAQELASLTRLIQRCGATIDRDRYATFDGSRRPDHSRPNLGAFAGMSLPGHEENASNLKGLGGFLREALKSASPEECEQVESLVSYLRTGRMEASADLTPSGDGGYLIPQFVSGTIERNFAAFTPILNVCRQLPTDTGAPITVPVLSDSETGALVAPAATTGADSTVSGDAPPTQLTGPTLNAYKISSKPVYVPRETIVDGSGDIISDVLAALLARVARYENYLYTRGSGSSQPQGVVTAATALLEASQLDLDVTLDLAYSVPALYRPNGIFMMSDATAKYLRKLKTGISGDKRVIWTDRNFQTGQPATLHGYRVEINNDLPDIAANGYVAGHEVIFGDFSKLVVRRAEQGSPFVYNYQVPAKDGRGLVVFRRSDSRLLVPEAIAKLSVGGS